MAVNNALIATISHHQGQYAEKVRKEGLFDEAMHLVEVQLAVAYSRRDRDEDYDSYNFKNLHRNLKPAMEKIREYVEKCCEEVKET